MTFKAKYTTKEKAEKDKKEVSDDFYALGDIIDDLIVAIRLQSKAR